MNPRLPFALLAVCGTTSFAGAMLIIALAFGPYWRGLPPTAFLDWFSANGHLIGRTIPVFVVPALVGLAGVLWIDWMNHGARRLWLASLAALAGVAVITVTYHLPTNALFTSKTLGLAEVGPTLDSWLSLHAVRTALGFTAAALGVMAVAQQRTRNAAGG